MIESVVLEALKAIIPEDKILLQEPMAGHTSFRIGGPADCLIEIETVEQLGKILAYLNSPEIGNLREEGFFPKEEVLPKKGWRRVPCFVLGNGSNLLVSDAGYRGVVLHIGSRMSQVTVSGDTVTAAAGALLSQTARAALEHGLTGFEFAAGIPGSIGGAAVMNAGAYGGEMKQVVQEVTVLTRDGKELVLDNAEMDFGYRTSLLKKFPYIVTKVVLQLHPGDPVQIRAKMDDLAARRREKQPLEFPSAGSTFKRPEGCFAGQLIEQAGLRGFQIGGARVSEKHCGFVINAGGATASDVFALMKEIQSRVKEMSGVELEPEVVLLGEF